MLDNQIHGGDVVVGSHSVTFFISCLFVFFLLLFLYFILQRLANEFNFFGE